MKRTRDKKTPMDIAAAGLKKAGTALEDVHTLGRATLPQFFLLGERLADDATRFVDAFERAVNLAEEVASRSRLVGLETTMRVQERADSAHAEWVAAETVKQEDGE